MSMGTSYVATSHEDVVYKKCKQAERKPEPRKTRKRDTAVSHLTLSVSLTPGKMSHNPGDDYNMVRPPSSRFPSPLVLPAEKLDHEV